MTKAAEQQAVDNWNEKDQQIAVAEGQGFLYNLKLRAKVDSTPALVYSILTDLGATAIFRNIKACTYRRVLEEDHGKKQRKLEVEHKALAKFLFISVTFETRLFVWEDDIHRKIRFCSAQEGFMKKFEGSWHVQPFNARSIAGTEEPLHSRLNPLSILNTKFGLHHQPEPNATLVTLEQAILPGVPVPPGIKGLMRRMCAKQLRDMVEDLRAEVDRREGRGKVGAVAKGKSAKAGPVGQAASAASLTMAEDWSIWDQVTPINITVKL